MDGIGNDEQKQVSFGFSFEEFRIIVIWPKNWLQGKVWDGLSVFCFDFVLRDSGCTLPWKAEGEVFRRWILLEPVWCVESYQNQTGVLKWEAIRSSENWKKMDGKYSVKWFKSFSIGSMGPVCLPTYIILSDQSNIGKYTNPMDRPWVLDRFSIFQQILVNSTTQFSKERVLPKNTGLKTMKVNLLVPTNKIMMMNILWSRGTAGPKMHQGFFWTCWKSPVYHVFLAHHTLICGALVGVLCFYKWNSGLLSKSYDNPSCCIQATWKCSPESEHGKRLIDLYYNTYITR